MYPCIANHHNLILINICPFRKKKCSFFFKMKISLSDCWNSSPRCFFFPIERFILLPFLFVIWTNDIREMKYVAGRVQTLNGSIGVHFTNYKIQSIADFFFFEWLEIFARKNNPEGSEKVWVSFMLLYDYVTI
jgi:hypothetical protein